MRRATAAAVPWLALSILSGCSATSIEATVLEPDPPAGRVALAPFLLGAAQREGASLEAVVAPVLHDLLESRLLALGYDQVLVAEAVYPPDSQPADKDSAIRDARGKADVLIVGDDFRIQPLQGDVDHGVTSIRIRLTAYRAGDDRPLWRVVASTGTRQPLPTTSLEFARSIVAAVEKRLKAIPKAPGR